MNNNQYKFKEGEIHQFKIVGFTEIPGAEESFFILKNEFEGKHLLKAVSYAHYELQEEQTINCKIDKINCSGKIYLEPENPIYKVGEIYDFKVIEIIDQLNSVGEKEKAVLVEDLFGIKIACSIPKSINENKYTTSIQCKVTRIKKGQLFLSHPESDNSKNKLEIGKKYCFKLTEIKELDPKIDYYILKDDNEDLYSLKKDMYEHYEFKINQKVECVVTKYNTDGHFKIEPVHPHYKIGKSYSFEFSEVVIDKDPLGNEEKVIIVKDVFGIETKVRSKNVDFKKTFPKYIHCKVEGIRKGKAILSLD